MAGRYGSGTRPARLHRNATANAFKRFSDAVVEIVGKLVFWDDSVVVSGDTRRSKNYGPVSSLRR